MELVLLDVFCLKIHHSQARPLMMPLKMILVEFKVLLRTLKGLIFASFSASHSQKFIPRNFLKMANSRKLIPQKISYTIYLQKKFQK